MSDRTIGNVLGIALRTRPKGPMQPIAKATAVRDRGLVGDVASRPDRAITLIAAEQWKQVTTELSADLPWHTRRANVLVDAASLADLIGKTIHVGNVEVSVVAESKPCGLMDRLHPGLRDALATDGRGGIYGRINCDGDICVGDPVRVAT